ncbi:phage tail tape measure protein [Streptomyces sp. NPDC005732]|uniref:phage tail tape measure protein n=1 Tax=Streptomyces sp. NPDC005732 TaxID=3157057 RepID=UPI0033CD79DB
MSNVGYATLQVIPSVRGISSELRRQLIGPAGDAGNDAGEAAGGGFRDAFTGALAAIGVTEIAGKIGEQFTDAFEQAMEQSNVTGQLKAQLGASSKDAARYGKVAGQLFAKGITDDIDAAAESVRATVQGGLVPKNATKQLRVISGEMSDFATSFGTDLSLQSQAVSAQLKNGLAKNAQEALDVMTTGFQKLGPNAEDLLETFQEYPVQLRKLGLDSKTALGLFSQGIKGGARDTDIIADSLKEFSIRSIDMSATSQAAYKSLGLSAKDMSSQIAKGGKGATAGLQTVLDKLRGIKDPVKQQAAAVGLFGTQAEELGASLFKLDPSKAVKAMGDTSGAAKQLGKDLHSGPAYELTVFQRSLKQAVVQVLGGQVLPILARGGKIANTVLLPPLKSVATTVASLLVPTFKLLWNTGKDVVGWLQDMGTWLIPIGIAVVGFTAAILAQQIATAATTAVFSIYRGAILAWTAVQRGATIAQAAFNAVMNANPVILVITAIVALAAAFYVAYQRSETFRSIVQGAWSGIQTAVSFTWNSVLKPAFAGLMVGVKAVGAAFSWLWSVTKTAFGYIVLAGKIMAAVLAVTVFLPITLSILTLIYVVPWLWTHAFKPTFAWIASGGLLLWAGLKVIFGYLMAGWRAVAAGAVWLWTNGISPVIGWVLTGLGLLWSGAKAIFGYFVGGLRIAGGWALWLYHSAIAPVVSLVLTGLGLLWSGAKAIFGYFVGGLKTVGGWAKWLWTSAVTPAINGVRNVISTVYNQGIKPTLSALRTAIGKVGDAFGTAKDAIKIAWDKVKGIAKAPVQFIVDTVYNRGIVGVWNKVASAFGAPTLKTFKFATGGPVFGAGTETSDDVPAWLSTNEHVWTAKEVRGAGGHGAVMALRKWAAAGGTGALPGFKGGGGLFGWIGKAGSAVAGLGSAAWDKIKSGAAWLKDTIAGSARAGVNAIVRPLLSRIPGLGSGIGDMIAKIPTKMVDALFGYADKADEKGASSSFGGGKIPSGQHAAIIKSALSAAGVPPPGTLAQWMSGLNTLITRESGWNASAVNRTDSNAKAGHPSQGLAQTIPGTFNAYVPASLRSRGILDPVANVAAAIRYIVSRYGNITNVQQADASKSPAGYAGGGRPRPHELFWVGERGPELMQLGASSATIWDSVTSSQMAGKFGPLRGFAKGTSSAKARAAARKQVPGDLTSAGKVLTASASDIRKAFDELTKDLRAAGGAGKALASSTTKASTKLQALAKQRDSVGARLEAAKTAASDQKKTAADFLGLSNLADVGSVGDLITGLQSRQSILKASEGTIASLSKRGLSQDLISQLVGMGPESTLASLVAGASNAQIAQLNSLAKSGSKLATGYGNAMADAMFDAGKNAAKGFLVGLQSQEKELQATMNGLGKTVIHGIEHKLKIKSPARALVPVGKNTALGVVVGLDNTRAQVAAAAARVADSAVPAVPTVSSASYAATAAAQGGALGKGGRVWLVLEDGRELAAYVDDRADGRVSSGLASVRQKVRSGSKR